MHYVLTTPTLGFSAFLDGYQCFNGDSNPTTPLPSLPRYTPAPSCRGHYSTYNNMVKVSLYHFSNMHIFHVLQILMNVSKVH